MSTFPEKPSVQFELEDLISYLLELQCHGLNIYKVKDRVDQFEIQLNQTFHIICSYDNFKKQVQVQFYRYEDIYKLGNVKNKIQLEQVISGFIEEVFGVFPAPSLSARLNTDTPATNFKSISNLIGSSEVTAVFDPYLENASLTTLIQICSFGNGKVGNSIRLLGSDKKTKGINPTFTITGVNAFLAQTGAAGSAKVIVNSNEHRRFILLTGGKSLLLGHSLNSIHKNEAIRIEEDTEDLTFFDTMWNKAILL